MMRWLVLCMGLLLGGVHATTGWAQQISRSEVEQAVGMRLGIALEEAGRGLFVTSLTAPGALTIPDGIVSWVLGVQVGGWEPGRHTVPVVVQVAGLAVARVQVTVALKQRVHTPVLQRDFKRGELVGPGDVQLQEVELSAPLPERVDELEKVVGQVVTRDVRGGQPLLERWLERPLAVDRGDRVRVTLIRGGLRIETSGVAMQRGRVGESISIRNAQSKMLFEAQITAPGEAQVRGW